VAEPRDKGQLVLDRIADGGLAVFALTAVASIVLQNLAFVAVAAWVAGMISRRRAAFRPSALNWPLLLLGAVLVASSLLAGVLNASLFGLRKVGLIAVFFLTAALVDQPVKVQRVLDLFLLGAVVCASWSILAHILGWDGGRARSFSGDYMAAGGMYLLGFSLALSRFLYARGRSGWFWLAAGLVLGLGLVFTYTRSSWIGAAVALLILGGAKDWRLPAAGLALVVAFLLVFPESPVAQRVFTISSKYTSSNVERRYMWDSGVKLFLDRPLAGYGVDNLSRVYARHLNPRAIEKNPPHVHNTPLQLALNGGLPAVVCFAWWAIAVLRLGYVAWKRNRELAPARAGAALGITAAFSGFLVNGLFEFNFGTSQVITLVYFLTGLLPLLADWPPSQPDFVLPRSPRLLFLRPRFLGDVLLAAPVARLIKRDFPGARVDLLTEPPAAAVAAAEPAWDEIIILPRKSWAAWWTVVRKIRARDYSVVADLFGNPRTAQLALVSGARLKIGPRVKGWEVVYPVRTRPDRPGPRPAWESYFDVLRTLGMKNLSFRPRWNLKPADQLWAGKFIAGRRLKPGAFLGIFPGGSHAAKRWPLERFLEVARWARRARALKSIFVFGPKERDLKQNYLRLGGSRSLCAEDLTPGQLAALWSVCAAVVSNDAFPMHVGPAVGTPTLALFGPGEPAVWFAYSRRAGHQAIHAAPACWPCRKDVCEDNICWRELTPEHVQAVLAGMLDARAGAAAKAGRRRA